MMEINKIYNIDCFEGMKQIEDNSIDLILTDPPFGINFEGNKWDKNIDFEELMVQLDKEFMRILKPGRIYITWLPKIEFLRILSYIKEVQMFVEIRPFGGHLKKGGVCNNITPLVYKFKDKPRRITSGFKNYFITNSSETQSKKQTNPGNIKHPCSKGILTCEYIVKHLSKENDLVLDPFAGSGTTCVSCKKLNRHFIGFEIESEYCKLAEERLRNVNKQTFLFGKENL